MRVRKNVGDELVAAMGEAIAMGEAAPEAVHQVEGW